MFRRANMLREFSISFLRIRAPAIFSSYYRVKARLLLGGQQLSHSRASSFTHSVVAWAHIGAHRFVIVAGGVDRRATRRPLPPAQGELAFERFEIGVRIAKRYHRRSW